MTSTVNLLIADTLVSSLFDARIKNLPRETGGFLLGMRRNRDIEIVNCTFQGTLDIASRLSFDRADPNHRRTIDAEWTKSGGIVGLVGDWHSHPRGHAAPSSTDNDAWRDLVKAVKNNCVGLILGEGELLRVFLVIKRWSHPKVVECKIKECSDGYTVYACTA